MSAAEARKLLVERRLGGRLLHLTLDAPKGNVLDDAMMREIIEALGEHGRDPALRAIAFEGAGKHFSFGASVEEHRADRVHAMLTRFRGVFEALQAQSLPTFAIVRGQCLGGGMELASYCSWIFASPDARFGQPEIKLAVLPPVASVLLPWRIGGGAALDLCLSGRTIDAAEAHRIGLVHEVAEDPRAAADAFFGAHLAGLSGSSLRLAERAARFALARAFREDLAAIEKIYLEELMRTPDGVEGIEAFVAKRTPVWSSERTG